MARSSRTPPGDQWDDILSTLYELVPEEFVSARDDLAGYVREEGDAALAARIAHLRRPTHGAWLLNNLVRTCPQETAALVKLGRSVRQAETELSGDRMRAAAAERREIVHSLIHHARDLAAQHDVRLSDEVERQVTESLDAVLADPHAAARFQDGCLTEALHAPPFIGAHRHNRPPRDT